MPRSTLVEPPPADGRSKDLSVEPRETLENTVSGLTDRDASVEDANSPLKDRHRALLSAIRHAMFVLESGDSEWPRTLVECQRKAIASIGESAVATLELTALLATASNGEEATRACLDHMRDRVSALEDMTVDFYDCALCLLGAVLLHHAVPTDPAASIPTRNGQDPRKVFARRVASLSNQQRCVLKLLLTGLPNKLIAHKLGISETTVKAHVSRVLERLNVFSRAQLIVVVARYGRDISWE